MAFRRGLLKQGFDMSVRIEEKLKLEESEAILFGVAPEEA